MHGSAARYITIYDGDAARAVTGTIKLRASLDVYSLNALKRGATRRTLRPTTLPPETPIA